MTPEFVWHGHHNVLISYLNIEQRKKEIVQSKPLNEQQTRLRLMKPVKAKLPKEFLRLNKARDRAEAAWYKADKARDKALNKADKAWDKALDKYKNLFEALHKKECNCKEWDGKEIVFS